MRVQGLIQAAGRGDRLGLGPKAFVALDGRTLLEHAVALLSDFADSIVVAAPPDDLQRAAALVGGSRVRVIAGDASRSGTTRRLIAEASASLLLLHDVVHPLASHALVERVLSAAVAGGCAAPAVPNTEFLYDRAGALLHAPGEVLVGQKPVAFARETALAGYAALPGQEPESDPSLLDILERGGARATFVTGCAENIKITTPADLRFARALLALAEEGASDAPREPVGPLDALGRPGGPAGAK